MSAAREAMRIRPPRDPRPLDLVAALQKYIEDRGCVMGTLQATRRIAFLTFGRKHSFWSASVELPRAIEDDEALQDLFYDKLTREFDRIVKAQGWVK